ncbi:MAG: hypothetical protein AAB903_03305 [Patescibacteria group bacterium]
MKKIIPISILFLGAILLTLIYYFSKPAEDVSLRIELATKNGLKVLLMNQLPHGEIPMQFCIEGLSESRCGSDRTPLFTSYTLVALHQLKDYSDVQTIAAKGVAFLKLEMTSSSMWRYVYRPHWYNLRPDIVDQRDGGVLADFDSTALASLALDLYDKTPNNKELFQTHRNNEGLLYLWERRIDGTQNEEIDCGAVANSLSYLADFSDVNSCNYLKTNLEKNKSCSLYYENGPVLDYFVGYAYVRTGSCLGDTRSIVIERVLSRQKFDGSFGNDMETAMALSTLLRLQYDQATLKKSVAWLLDRQEKSGLWSRQNLFHFNEVNGGRYTFGSEELTTALVLEALFLYRTNQK